MQQDQDWHTEAYKGMEVHVTALPKDERGKAWDYTVRVTQPGDDSSSEAELTAESGDDRDFPTEEAAVEAGFMRGYSMVDAMFQ
ncbi:MAG TPA: hypothetical protein VEB70_01335 [Noviherbaspirillum sp.]|nr:hypothetical protein [Noviherbaspirillum sp.]